MSVHLVTGDDEALLRAAVNDLVRELVGDGDRSLMVDEFDGDEYELRAVLDAAQTPPFLTDRRVVVARGVGRFSADDVAGLVDYVRDPLDATDLVLVGGEGRIAKRLTDAVNSVGTVRNASPPSRPKDRASWVAEHVAASGVRLDARALAEVTAWLGEDVGRLDGVVATLRSAFGTAGVLSSDDVAPFLGEAGGVPPWDLTDAIDAGNTVRAVTLLGRMTHAGDRHPLQIMAILHAHYSNVAKLDGVDARSEADAMAATGAKSSFPARKALDNYRRLGPSGVKRAFELLADADLDLRGARELPPELVMEVLVARLTKLRR